VSFASEIKVWDYLKTHLHRNSDAWRGLLVWHKCCSTEIAGRWCLLGNPSSL